MISIKLIDGENYEEEILESDERLEISSLVIDQQTGNVYWIDSLFLLLKVIQLKNYGKPKRPILLFVSVPPSTKMIIQENFRYLYNYLI